jgi:hypothetical protein
MTDFEQEPGRERDPSAEFDAFATDLAARLQAIFDELCRQKEALPADDPRHGELSMIEGGVTIAKGHADILARTTQDKSTGQSGSPWADLFTRPNPDEQS